MTHHPDKEPTAAASLFLIQTATGQPPQTDQYIIWAVLSLAAAIILFALELFIPSGGFIGFLAVVAVVIGIVLLFQVNTVLGLICAIVTIIALPFLFMLAMKIWPNTPLAKKLILGADDPEKNETPASGSQDRDLRAQLINKTGKALTDLRPVGTCLIDGQRQDCLAQVGVIDAGCPIRVVSVDGMQIIVRVDDATAVSEA